jgi:hypothetical protein
VPGQNAISAERASSSCAFITSGRPGHHDDHDRLAGGGERVDQGRLRGAQLGRRVVAGGLGVRALADRGHDHVGVGRRRDRLVTRGLDGRVVRVVDRPGVDRVAHRRALLPGDRRAGGAAASRPSRSVVVGGIVIPDGRLNAPCQPTLQPPSWFVGLSDCGPVTRTRCERFVSGNVSSFLSRTRLSAAALRESARAAGSSTAALAALAST